MEEGTPLLREIIMDLIVVYVTGKSNYFYIEGTGRGNLTLVEKHI